MKLTRVEHAFDGSRLLFYYTAEHRVDFRELVRDLAAAFHMRIEMRQIGVRDEAKLLGGYGPCGRPLCCTTWLTTFEPVSIKMAKQQGLSLNPSKLAGVCGRLKCCLRYELPNSRGERHAGCAQEGSCSNGCAGDGACGTIRLLLREVIDAMPRATATPRPRIAITVGDPAGIGPEIAIAAANSREVRAVCEPVLYGPHSSAALDAFAVGQVSAAAGQAAYDAIVAAVSDAQSGVVRRDRDRARAQGGVCRLRTAVEGAYRPARPPDGQPAGGDDVLLRAAARGAGDGARAACATCRAC